LNLTFSFLFAAMRGSQFPFKEEAVVSVAVQFQVSCKELKL